MQVKGNYLLIRLDWIDDKIESNVTNNDLIDDEQKEFLIQFFTITTEKKNRQNSIESNSWWSFIKNDSNYQVIVQLESNYYLVDIHEKYLMYYEFNRSSLEEKQIFLAQCR